MTGIIFHFHSYHLFDSHSRESQSFSFSNGSSVLHNFSSLQQVENYAENIRLEHKSKEQQYFQLKILETVINDIRETLYSINRSIL